MADELVDKVESNLGRRNKHGYRYNYRPGGEHGRIKSFKIWPGLIGDNLGGCVTAYS